MKNERKQVIAHKILIIICIIKSEASGDFSNTNGIVTQLRATFEKN